VAARRVVVVVVVDFIFQQVVSSAHIGLICQGVLRAYRHTHTCKKRKSI